MTDLRWLLLIAAMFTIVQAILYRRLSLYRVTYRRYFSESVIYAGDKVEMVEVIENKKWLPIPRIVLEAAFDASMKFGGDYDAFLHRSEKFLTVRSIFALKPYTRITRRHQIECLKRGVYQLNTAAMTTGGIFGGDAFKQWSFSGKGTTLTVYPKLFPDFDEVLPSHSFLGETRVRRFIMPDPFMRQGARPYQSGDPMNQIHWKATARTGALHVHLQEFTADYQVKILLNFVVQEDMWQHIVTPERIEAGIGLAATLANHWLLMGCEVGFNCNGLHQTGENPSISPESGATHLESILTMLAGLELKLRCDGSALLKEELEASVRTTDYVLITGFVDTALQDAIDALQFAGHSVTVVELPSERIARNWMADMSRNLSGGEGLASG